MNRNYESARHIRQNFPNIAQWADSSNTSEIVAAAIHAIADSNRSAEEIWEAPTKSEYDHVIMAVLEYLYFGDYEPDENGYFWGETKIIEAE